MLEVCLLGRFEVKYGTEVIPITSRPAQSLFAFLILNAESVHRREKLAGLLWPESLEKTARDNLRHALWRIRKALPKKQEIEYFLTDDLSIGFNGSAEYRLDVTELGSLNADATSNELMKILSVYEGALLPGFYDEWVMSEREHLSSIFEHHMARLISLLQGEKRWLDILDWGERWIRLGQKPEPAYRALMSAHAAKGDMSKVAAIYERCVNSLSELGVEPSEQTKILYERLKSGKGFPETRPAIRSSEKYARLPDTNLPSPITSFIGRKREVEEIVRLMSQNRLVTLTGVGGVGKTRLAIQLSRSMLEEFDDGVWWVELAPLMDETLIPQAVARVLGVRETPAQLLTESLKTFLREKQLLLVLDNCEHLIDTCAQFAHDLLTQCAKLKILSTSREALEVMGELEYQVQPLSLPVPERLTIMDILLEYEGIRLFAERSNAKSGFTLTEQNATSVISICQQLDGIPLAIELTAARTRTLPIEYIADHLNDRFNLLTQGNRTALPRHQTLRALIDWSYDLLSEPERVLWVQLSVFKGGWILSAAEAVCLDHFSKSSSLSELLSQLVDKSIVLIEEQVSVARYHMLETIRQYGQEKLKISGNEGEIRRRHVDFFIQLAEQAEPELLSGEQKKMLEQLDREYGNLRLAINWSMENDTGRALRLATALGHFYTIHGFFSEGKNIIEQALERTIRPPKRMCAKALLWIGVLSHDRGNYLFAEESFKKSVKLWRELGDQQGLAMSLNSFGLTAWVEGNNENARGMFEESLRLYRLSNNKRGISAVLQNLGNVARSTGDLFSAYQYMKESAAIARELDNRLSLASVLNDLGVVAEEQGDYTTAHRCFKESITISNEFGVKDNEAFALNSLAHVLYLQGELVESKKNYQKSLTLFRETGDKRGVAYCLEGFAKIASRLGFLTHAASLLGASDMLRETIHAPLGGVEAVELRQDLTAMCQQLGDKIFETAFEDGQAMTMERAINFALEESE